MTDERERGARKLERLEVEASNNLAHAFQHTPRNSDAIASIGPYVARYRDAVAERSAAAAHESAIGDAIKCVEDLMSWSSKHDGGPWTDKDDALEALTRLRALEVDNGAQPDE